MSRQRDSDWDLLRPSQFSDQGKARRNAICAALLLLAAALFVLSELLIRWAHA